MMLQRIERERVSLPSIWHKGVALWSIEEGSVSAKDNMRGE